MFNSTEFQQKTILITGGGRGIGAACVQAFAAAGAAVHFFYRQNLQTAEALCHECNSKNQHVTAYKVDVCDKRQVMGTIEEIVANTGGIDILVNNSGIVRDGLLAALTDADIHEVIDTNIHGVFNTTQAVVPHMMRARRGKIINISSVAGEKGGRGQTNYAASKGAINAFTKSLAVELAKRGITVNAVAPGVIETSLSAVVRDLGGEEALNKIVLQRYGQPEEIAHAVLFLASRYADYITGEILHVDGGFKLA